MSESMVEVVRELDSLKERAVRVQELEYDNDMLAGEVSHWKAETEIARHQCDTVSRVWRDLSDSYEGLRRELLVARQRVQQLEAELATAKAAAPRGVGDRD